MHWVHSQQMWFITKWTGEWEDLHFILFFFRGYLNNLHILNPLKEMKQAAVRFKYSKYATNTWWKQSPLCGITVVVLERTGLGITRKLEIPNLFFYEKQIHEYNLVKRHGALRVVPSLFDYWEFRIWSSFADKFIQHQRTSLFDWSFD